MDDELEKEFSDGRKIDFFMNSFKDALEDFENHSDMDGAESGEGAAEDLDSTLYMNMKDKKCRALVWMKVHEYPLIAGSGMTNGAGIASPPGSGYISFGGVGGI